MKAQKPGTDWTANVVLRVNGKPSAEYVLPDKTIDQPNILECFVPAAPGQRLAIHGHFAGSTTNFVADLIVDGSFLRQTSFNSSHGLVTKNYNIKFDKAMTIPFPKDWTSIEHPKGGIEGNMHVDKIDENVAEDFLTYENPVSGSRRAGVGSIQVVLYASQHVMNRHKDKEWNITLGVWKDTERQEKKDVRKSGIKPEYEVKLEKTTEATAKRGFGHHKHWHENTRPGFKEVARLIFYYRSQAAIDAASCIVRADEEQKLEQWDENAELHGRRHGEFKEGEAPARLSKKPGPVHRDDEEDEEDAGESESVQGPATEAQGNEPGMEIKNELHTGLPRHKPLQRLDGSLFGTSSPMSLTDASHGKKRASSTDDSTSLEQLPDAIMGNIKHTRNSSQSGPGAYANVDTTIDIGTPFGDHARESRKATGEMKRGDPGEVQLGADAEDGTDHASTHSHDLNSPLASNPAHQVHILPRTIESDARSPRKPLRFQSSSDDFHSTLLGDLDRPLKSTEQLSLPVLTPRDHRDSSELAAAAADSSTGLNHTTIDAEMGLSSDTKWGRLPTREEILAEFSADSTLTFSEANALFERHGPHKGSVLSRTAFNQSVREVADQIGTSMFSLKPAYSKQSNLNDTDAVSDQFSPDSADPNGDEMELEPPRQVSNAGNHMQNRGHTHFRDTSATSRRPSSLNKQSPPQSHSTIKSSIVSANGISSASTPRIESSKRIRTAVRPSTEIDTTPTKKKMPANSLPPSSGVKRAANAPAAAEPSTKRYRKDEKSRMAKDNPTPRKTGPTSASVSGASTPMSKSEPSPAPIDEEDLDERERRLDKVRAEIAEKKAKLEQIRAAKQAKNEAKAARKAEKERKAREAEERKAREEAEQKAREEEKRRRRLEEEEENLKNELAGVDVDVEMEEDDDESDDESEAEEGNGKKANDAGESDAEEESEED
ncbi:hypothetical protein AC579_873 [Pseudocercospora musae]|uniref:Uncharacterized protein n=1 Tax=Pseudocercospora musae TaxID=113226 RepID=A0A139I4G8_9PEZI|nr:hypothetical protein AC579_873 [Pseudocercospora musae]